MKRLNLLEDNKRRLLEEAFGTIENLKQQLSPEMIAIMNDSVGGNDNWSTSNKWTDAHNMASSVSQAKALCEIFILYVYKNWHCNLQQLEPGKDILISLIDQLGFKQDENPYLDFMIMFFGGRGKGVVLSEDDWISLNDLYADGTLEPSDLMGAGKDKTNHIIFNPTLYKDGNISSDKDNLVKAYEWLSSPQNIKSLNLKAVAGNEEVEVQRNTSIGTKASNVELKPIETMNPDSDAVKIKNLIMFEGGDPLGNVRPFYTVKTAISAGLNNINDTNSATVHNNKSKKYAFDTLKNLSEQDRLDVIKKLVDAGLLKVN